VDDLRRRLRETAEAHQPDRDAMLVRIERGMARSDGSDRARSFHRRKQASWLKVSLAILAVVGVTVRWSERRLSAPVRQPGRYAVRQADAG